MSYDTQKLIDAPPSHIGEPVDPARAREAVRRVRASRSFGNLRAVSEFLEYIVEARLTDKVDGLKETSIGVGLYGRDPAYDPKLDSIVRTQAKRLRDRLDEYYSSEGAADPIVIRLPRGGYTPIFEARAPLPAKPEDQSAGTELPIKPRASRGPR